MDRQQDALRRLGAGLTEIRKRKDLTQAQLAALTGLDPTDISAIEAGELDPTITMLLNLARGLGLSPSELLASE